MIPSLTTALPGVDVVLDKGIYGLNSGLTVKGAYINRTWFDQAGTDFYLYGAFEDETAITAHSPGKTTVTHGDKILVGAGVASMPLFNTESGNTLRIG